MNPTLMNTMNDFDSAFWDIYLFAIAVGGIIGVWIILYLNSTYRLPKGQTATTTGHIWDEDLSEWNNPMPRWWILKFHLLTAFALIYLVLYPGVGRWDGLFHWTMRNQYDNEMKRAQELYGPIFDKYKQVDIPTLAAGGPDSEALKMGKRIFLVNCSVCHGSDAKGATRGFPNLTDNDWLWGGDPDTIVTTITEGRGEDGVKRMPDWGDNGTLTPVQVENVANYVLSFSKPEKADAAKAAQGKQTFDTICYACHGPEGKGTQAVGAPNLTDNIWLYGGDINTIIQTVTHGRGGHMPTWKERLGDAKIHLVAAYVYSLSHPAGGAPEAAPAPAPAQ